MLFQKRPMHNDTGTLPDGCLEECWEVETHMTSFPNHSAWSHVLNGFTWFWRAESAHEFNTHITMCKKSPHKLFSVTPENSWCASKRKHFQRELLFFRIRSHPTKLEVSVSHPYLLLALWSRNARASKAMFSTLEVTDVEMPTMVSEFPMPEELTIPQDS